MDQEDWMSPFESMKASGSNYARLANDEMSQLQLSVKELDEIIEGAFISGVCDQRNFEEATDGIDTTHSLYGAHDPSSSLDDSTRMVNSACMVNDVSRPYRRNTERPTLDSSNVALSRSVNVNVSQESPMPSRIIQVVYELEETYRSRYKSDYFGQNGKSRKPRYVCDRHKNHFITLKVPVGRRGRIRVDWLTIPDAANCRYRMPYHFQVDNDSSEVPDVNPIYIEILPDGNGIMKLYLVLIKAKQDALKSFYSLEPFHPIQDAFGLLDANAMETGVPLTPKALIQKYQLEKSQLAFTLCTESDDGGFVIPQWNTTVFSTVLTETAASSSGTMEVECPGCFERLTVTQDEDAVTGQTRRTVKRKFQ